MKIGLYISASIIVGLSISACSTETRSKDYFKAHPKEARDLIADKSNCPGPDRSKIIAGTDECTNAHQAVKSLEVEEYNEQQRKANGEAAKNGGFTPKLKRD
jgi:hypothetical protein